MQWKYETSYALYTSPLVSSVSGAEYVYFGGNDANLYALRANGSLLWKHSVDSDDIINNALVVNGEGEVTFGTSLGVIRKLSHSGNVLWTATPLSDTGHAPYDCFDSRILIDKDENVYMGCQSPPVFSSISSSGVVNWQYTAPLGFSGSPALSNRGVIFAATEDGNIYAIGSRGSTTGDTTASSSGGGDNLLLPVVYVVLIVLAVVVACLFLVCCCLYREWWYRRHPEIQRKSRTSLELPDWGGKLNKLIRRNSSFSSGQTPLVLRRGSNNRLINPLAAYTPPSGGRPMPLRTYEDQDDNAMPAADMGGNPLHFSQQRYEDRDGVRGNESSDSDEEEVQVVILRGEDYA